MNRIEEQKNGGTNGHRRTAELEQEIEQTRSRLDQTVDELAEKLDPREQISAGVDWLKNQIANADPERMREYGNKAAGYARENPVPVALGALTLVSMFMPRPSFSSNNQARTAPTGTPYRQRASDWDKSFAAQTISSETTNGSDETSLKDSAHETWDSVKDTVSETREEWEKRVSEKYDRTSAKLHDAAETARIKSRKMADETRIRMERGKDEYPVCMGLGAFALGLLAALGMPGTRKEDELMGETSDRAMNKVVDHTKDVVEQAREEVKDAVDRTKEKVEGKMEEKGLTLDNLHEKTDAAIDNAAEKVEQKISGTNPE